jgi:hypothetical protein
MMSKVDRMLVIRAALKGIVAEAEEVMGINAALTVTIPATTAIDASDLIIRDLTSPGSYRKQHGRQEKA